MHETMNSFPGRLAAAFSFLAGIVAVFTIPGGKSFAAGNDKIVLVEDHQPRAAIVIPAAKGRPAELAGILVAHLEAMTGARLSVIAANGHGQLKVEAGHLTFAKGPISPQITSFILIGESDLTKALGFTNEGLGFGGMAIETTGNVLALHGMADGYKSPGGDTYAVYQFLEQLGCRWLWPGETGKVIPKRATLVVGPLAIRHTPPLSERKMRFHQDEKIGEGLARLGIDEAAYAQAQKAACTTPTGGEWKEWMCLGGNMELMGGHNGAGLGHDGWEKYGKVHPEWFALQADSTRDQSGTKNRWRLCVSNMGLIECVADKIISELKEHPAASVSLSPNDGGYSSFCMCEACKKLDPPDAPKVKINIFKKAGQPEREEIEYVSLTDRYVWYWNHVAERVTKVFPNQLFSVDAYSAYQSPPVREKLHPNLVVRYVPNDLKGWTSWQQAGARRIFWRPNLLNSGRYEGTLNRFYAPDFAERMPYLAQHNMIGTDMDSCYHNWATAGLTYFAAARLDWNPALKFEDILDDYCTHGFGPAAGPVKRYFQRVAALRDPVKDGRSGRTVSMLEQYTPAVIEDLRGLLNEAERAAGAGEVGKAIGQRIAFLKSGLEFTAVTAEAKRLVLDAEAGRTVDATVAGKIMERRWRMMRDMALNMPLAVNMPYVIASDEAVWRPLKWKAPTAQASAPKAARKRTKRVGE